jgi:hypothetical protein
VGELLTQRGRISVFENVYDGFVIDNFPGWLIFRVTGNARLTKVAQKLGANTAGVGVCFLSKKRWLSTMSEANLHVLESSEPDNWNWTMPLLSRCGLHLRRRYVGHFWLKAQNV